MNRRSFLSRTAMGIGALAATACTDPNPPAMSATSEPAQIALQLWTVRDAIAQDPAATIERIAAMGYPAVETAFFPESLSIQDAARLIRNAGMNVCASHCELPLDDQSQATILEMAEAYQCNRMIWHGWPEDPRYKTAEGTRELIEVYHQALIFAQSNGLEFGIHNHWWEFETHDRDHRPYQLLLEELDPAIFFELDTYWIKVAGPDPAAIVGQFSDRARFLHIKDGPAKWNRAMDADEPEPMVAVGQGVLDFPAIVQAAAGNTDWMVVELDNCATDMLTAVAESYTYLTQQGLAKGAV